MRMSKFQHRLHVYRMAIQMHRENGTRAGGQHSFELTPVHGIGLWINVNKNGSGSHHRNRLNGCNKSVGDGNDFITRAYSTCSKSQGQSIRSRREAYPILTSTIGCEFLLELLKLWAKK